MMASLRIFPTNKYTQKPFGMRKKSLNNKQAINNQRVVARRKKNLLIKVLTSFHPKNLTSTARRLDASSVGSQGMCTINVQINMPRRILTASFKDQFSKQHFT